MAHELIRILSAVALTPWAMREDRLCEIVAVLCDRHASGPLEEDEVARRLALEPDSPVDRVAGELDITTQMAALPGGAATPIPQHQLQGFDAPDKFAEGQLDAAGRPRRNAPGSVAVVPLLGVISNRIHQVNRISGPGGTSAEGFARQVRQAAAKPEVKAIVLDVDSPGGTVDGVAEAADAVFEARQTKHVVAVANAHMHSAAYWIASQADEVVATPTGDLGSIGVRTAHVDQSGMLEQEGIKVTTVSAGKFKGELLPFGPPSKEALEHLQERVNDAFTQFTDQVARGRGVEPSEVREGFGQGRSLMAKRAVRAGLADRIATMDQVLERLGVGAQPAAGGDGAKAQLAERRLALRRMALPRR